MSGVSDLGEMLAEMRPRLREGSYVFLSLTGPVPRTLSPVMTFTEDEGLTVIVTRGDADAAGIPYDLVTAWITLTVHSSLEGVGLTAAVSRALADAGIACNLVAATFHDHLFVPAGDASRALSVLESLSAANRRPT